MPKKLPYRLIFAIALACFFSVGLLLIRIFSSDSTRYIFLIWNLVLAITPLLLSVWLVSRIGQFGWLAWPQILLTIIWLSFLPNSFYLVSDFVHLRPNFEASLIYDIVMLMSFALNGLILGFMSLYLVHKELRKRLSFRGSYGLILLVLLACSFATYLGRYTRWNSWDLVLRPAGLLFDVSDRFINPGAHGVTYVSTLLFFGLLSTAYVVVYEAIRELKKSK